MRTDDIVDLNQQARRPIAVVMFAGVNFFTGQLFDIEKITAAARKHGIIAGFDLAHAIGNVPLSLHDWNVDFAVWCSYKYLNAGPGAVAGAFVHERHATKQAAASCGFGSEMTRIRAFVCTSNRVHPSSVG